MKSSLIGIAVKPMRLQPMQILASATLSVDEGLVGDSRGAPGPRQVTVLSLTAWQAAGAEIGAILPWTERRANLLVSDLPVFQSIGARLIIGEAVLEVTGETDPCARMTAVHPDLFKALERNWRGGVCCRVIQGGLIAQGMEVVFEIAGEAGSL